MIFLRLLSVLLALPVCLLAAALPPEKLLPADTLGFVTAPSWDAVVTAFHQNSLGQLWADPEMRPFREKFQSRCRENFLAPLEKELAFSFTNLARLLHGQVTLAFTPESTNGAPGTKSGRLFFADTGTNTALLATFLADWQSQWTNAGRQAKAVRIRDLDFTTVALAPEEVNRLLDKIVPSADAPGPETAPKQAATKVEWTVGQTGGLLIVSDSPRAIEKLLTLQAGAAQPALAEQAAYAADAGHFRDSQVSAWLNLKAIFERLAKEPAPAAEGAGKEAPTVSIAKLFGAVGFAEAQTLAANLQQSAAGLSLSLRVSVPEATRKGLLRALSLEARECAPPSFVPADTVKFTRLRLDLPRAWTNIEATLTEISPGAAGAIRFIIANAGKQKNLDFDLRQILLARLGDDLIVYERFPRSSSAKDTESPPSLWLVGARNPEQAAAALKAIAELPPPAIAKYKEREFLGRTIYSFNWPSSAEDGSAASITPVTYAPNGGYVVLSSDPALVEEFLRGSSGSGRALRDRPGLAEAAQRVGGMSAGYFATANLAESARSFFAAARQDSFNAAALLGKSALGSRLGVGRESSLLDWCDFSLLPPYERVARYFHFDVSSVSANAGGYTYRFFAPAPPPAGKP